MLASSQARLYSDLLCYRCKQKISSYSHDCPKFSSDKTINMSGSSSDSEHEQHSRDASSDEESDEKESKWEISKRLQDGSMSYIHIRQPIKLLLPREYIVGRRGIGLLSTCLEEPQ